MIHEVLMWFGQPCPCLQMRELFHYKIKNITEDITRCNYWVPKTSHVSPLFISLPHHNSSCSTEYLPFFLTPLFTSYSLYRPIFISYPHDLEYLQRYFQQPSLFYKSNIAIIYQSKNIQYNIFYKKEIYTNQKFGHFLTISTLDQIP